jgi:hypothetical protein
MLGQRSSTALIGLLVLLPLGGCGTSGSNPAFESTTVEASPTECPEGRLCVEIRAPVDGTEPGQGTCSLYGPGDPEELEPLATSDDLAMNPGEVATWITELPDEYAVNDLNAVCSPMAEG